MKNTTSSYEKKEKIRKVVRVQSLENIYEQPSLVLMGLDSNLLMCRGNETGCKIDHREPTATRLRDARSSAEHEPRGGTTWHVALGHQSLPQNA
jgi:hypothetical protein